MAFRFDKFTHQSPGGRPARQDLAADAAIRRSIPLHLLAALLAEDEGIVEPMLDKIGVNRAQLDRIVEAELNHFPKGSGGGPPQPSQALMQVFEAAQREAGTMKDEFVSTEHLLLALAKADSKAKSMLKLNAIGEKRAARGDARRPRQPARHRPEPRRPSSRRCEKYGIDLVERASKASSIRSSAATRKSAASSRSSRAARRTTRC